MFALRAFQATDAGAVVAWFADRQAAICWGGAKVPERLTPQWLIEQAQVNSCWVWRDEKDAPIGIFGMLLPKTQGRRI